MESQTLKYARMLGDASGGWRTESSAITESAQTFDNVTLTAQSWALLTRISRELLADGENIDAALMNSFAAGAALGIDAAILYGTGTAPMPRGITNTSGIQSVSMGTNGGQLLTTAGWSKMLDAVAALEGANLGTVSAMIMAPRTARQIYGFVDTTGQPLTVPPRLAGIPILTTTAASVTETQGTSGAVASSILLGDFSQVILGLRNSLQISVLNERYADTGQIGFVSWIRADVLVARPAALARIIGILP
jgi:HK97 family phage major capsid protein